MLSEYISMRIFLRAFGMEKLENNWERKSCGRDPNAIARFSQQMVRFRFFGLACSMALSRIIVCFITVCFWEKTLLLQG
jgi:hypothetical protein